MSSNSEHLLNWIENSRKHYEWLLLLESERRKGPFSKSPAHFAYLARAALSLASNAFREAVRGGDMIESEWSAAELLETATALLAWEHEQ